MSQKLCFTGDVNRMASSIDSHMTESTADSESESFSLTDDEIINSILDILARTAPEIRNGLPGRRVKTNEENPSGESPMEADVFADELLRNRLGSLDGIGEYASEERSSADDTGSGLSVCIDPLDGSSNLKSNAAMGTIAAVYDAPLPARGSDLVAAAYVLYGATTTMIAAVEGNVADYVIYQDGSYEPIEQEVRVPSEPTVYGFGGRVPNWPRDFNSFVSDIESDTSMKLRYGGAMVGDVNQVLTYGGIFGYPALTNAPSGKLRVQFEGYPIGYIIECAGGASSDGSQSLLAVESNDIHDRTPVYVGTPSLVERLEDALAGKADSE